MWLCYGPKSMSRPVLSCGRNESPLRRAGGALVGPVQSETRRGGEDEGRAREKEVIVFMRAMMVTTRCYYNDRMGVQSSTVGVLVIYSCWMRWGNRGDSASDVGTEREKS